MILLLMIFSFPPWYRFSIGIRAGSRQAYMRGQTKRVQYRLPSPLAVPPLSVYQSPYRTAEGQREEREADTVSCVSLFKWIFLRLQIIVNL